LKAVAVADWREPSPWRAGTRRLWFVESFAAS